MSHFAVAVLSDGTKTLEELLAPHRENNMGDVPHEFCEFYDAEEEERKEYETGTKKYVMYEGRLVPPFDNVFLKPDANTLFFSPKKYEVPEDLPRVDVPFTVLFPIFEDYLREYCGYEEVDPETGRYGYWENPNAKWDYYVIGGRWEGWANEVLGGTSLRIGDIAFDSESERRKAEEWWDNTDHDDPIFKIIVNDRTKEQYVESESHLSFRACITPDGKWHEVAKMGWWGISSESGDEQHDWDIHFTERFLTDPDLILTVVDCHT